MLFFLFPAFTQVRQEAVHSLQCSQPPEIWAMHMQIPGLRAADFTGLQAGVKACPHRTSSAAPTGGEQTGKHTANSLGRRVGKAFLRWSRQERISGRGKKKVIERLKITDSRCRQDANAELFQQSFTPQDLRAPWAGEMQAAPMEVTRGMLLLYFCSLK